ncbi:HET-domain-containing protein [Apiospora sp. TS-2023a]
MGNFETCSFCARELDVLKPWRLETLVLSQLDIGIQEGCTTCKFRKQAISCVTTDPTTPVVFAEEQKRFRVGRKCTEYDDQFDDIAKGNLISGSTALDESFQSMRMWIRDCVETHSGCSKGGKFFSKRLLDVGCHPAVLRENADLAPYACLSHCWGPNQSPIRTTTNNIQEFRNEVPWDQLSKTFQDAVDICRRLDIRYIWIDSLCIIQEGDGFADWKEQSVDLGRIYANAFVTIAATKSKDGTGGCYASRSLGHVEAWPIEEGKIYVREQMPYFKPGKIGMQQAPLLSRGWVYQEMMLSPRVLHFCEQDISWGCRTEYKSESGSNDAFVNGVGESSSEGKRYPTDMMSWYRSVNDYTRLALTKDKDRLPALAALAQKAAESRPGDHYLAGLWQHTLLWDLLWQTESFLDGERPAARPEEWCGPSWSWASVKTRVKWVALLRFNAQDRPLTCTRLLAIDVEPDGSRYLGQFRRAQISFRGPLLATTLGKLETMTTDYPDRDARLQLDESLSVHEFTPDCTLPASGADAVPREWPVFILPLMVGLARIYTILGPALWLREDRGGNKNAYERIGLVELNYMRRTSDFTSVLPLNEATTEAGRKLRSDYFIQGKMEEYQWADAYLCGLPSFEVIIK